MLKNSNAFSAFSVDNLEKALAFYKDKLGLEVEEIKAEYYSMLTIHISSDYKIQIYPKPNHEPATYTMLYFQVENTEKAVDDLIASGITFEHYEAEGIKTDAKGIDSGYGTPPKAWFKDPAGNILCVIEKG